MLKINLLPSYIYERKKIRAAWAVVVALILLEIAALAMFQAQQIGKEADLIRQVEADERRANEVQQLVSQAAAERAKIDPIRAKVQYIKDILAFNLVRPRL